MWLCFCLESKWTKCSVHLRQPLKLRSKLYLGHPDSSACLGSLWHPRKQLGWAVWSASGGSAVLTGHQIHFKHVPVFWTALRSCFFSPAVLLSGLVFHISSLTLFWNILHFLIIVPELSLSLNSLIFVPGASSIDTATAFLVPVLEQTLCFPDHPTTFLCACSSLI